MYGPASAPVLPCHTRGKLLKMQSEVVFRKVGAAHLRAATAVAELHFE